MYTWVLILFFVSGDAITVEGFSERGCHIAAAAVKAKAPVTITVCVEAR